MSNQGIAIIMLLLMERLFDVQTRLKSNVAGRGKERLDLEVMRYIKPRYSSFTSTMSLK